MDLTENIVNDALDRYPNEYPSRLKAETLRELANIERAAYIRGRKDERQLRESQKPSTSDEALHIGDVVVPKGKLCDHAFKHLKFVRDRQIVCKCGERFSY